MHCRSESNSLSNPEPYNPLERRNLEASIAKALLARKPLSLASLQSFNGAGIYAIYYKGSFPLYEPLVNRNKRQTFPTPIYVGKAIPRRTRKNSTNIFGVTKTKVLFRHLKNHASCIKAAKNLKTADFLYQFLIVDEMWIAAGESLLIAKFAPIWNNTINGFGDQESGRGRNRCIKPRWDVLHPGRAWANRYEPRKENLQQIQADVAHFLRSLPDPRP